MVYLSGNALTTRRVSGHHLHLTWGGAAQASELRAHIVLVPHDRPVPELTDDLAGATVVRTPVERIAVNTVPFEAMLTALGVDDRLVAVGGLKTYNDNIRERTRAGKLAQIGYGWHIPPNLDALVASRPDVFLMSLGDLGHTQHLNRIRGFGIAVLPTFVDAEPTYMGKVDYIRLVGMLTGREREANAFVADVERRVEALKAAAAQQPEKTVVSAWYEGGERWFATVRNADAQMLRDANARNLLEQPDDPRLDAFTRVGTERMPARARDADCWVIRDTHSQPYTNIDTLRQFKAWRDGCLFASDGLSKPEHDVYDIYERGVIPPDLLLGDLVRMLHPPLRDEPFVYIRPDTRTPR